MGICRESRDLASPEGRLYIMNEYTMTTLYLARGPPRPWIEASMSVPVGILIQVSPKQASGVLLAFALTIRFGILDNVIGAPHASRKIASFSAIGRRGPSLPLPSLLVLPIASLQISVAFATAFLSLWLATSYQGGQALSMSYPIIRLATVRVSL